MIRGFPNAYNLNHQYQIVSNGGPLQKGHKIPNRIPVQDYDCTGIERYISPDTFNTVTVMDAPIFEKAA
jgi:hypothetical protein